MYNVKVVSYFNSAHRLRDYKGKCEALHGHNWRVEVTVSSKVLKRNGMVMDFSDLKRELKKILEKLDHSFLNENKEFLKKNPTSENIARFIYDDIRNRVRKYGADVKNVTVWETPNSCACYEKG